MLQKSPFITNEKKQSKQFFKENLNNLKNIWKGIRSMIVIKHSSVSNIHRLTHKVVKITDSFHFANIFNDYFCTIVEKTKVNIKFSNKSFQDFIIFTTKSLLSKMLKLLENEISTQLASIFFNRSFPIHTKSCQSYTSTQKKNQSCYTCWVPG